ncbi:hypothetical protein V6N13_120409 [Hibiscus sabdariffa]
MTVATSAASSSLLLFLNQTLRSPSLATLIGFLPLALAASNITTDSPDFIIATSAASSSLLLFLNQTLRSPSLATLIGFLPLALAASNITTDSPDFISEPSEWSLVVGQLLDDECPEDFIKGLILSVRSLLPVEPLVEECEKRLDNFDGPTVGEVAVEAQLYEEALAIFRKFNLNVQAVNVLLDNIRSIDRAVEFAFRVEEDAVWSRVAKAQLREGLGSDAIESFIRADYATQFLDVYHDLLMDDILNTKELVKEERKALQEELRIEFSEPHDLEEVSKDNKECEAIASDPSEERDSSTSKDKRACIGLHLKSFVQVK